MADLTPNLSLTVLACTGGDLNIAFDSLHRFLRKTACEPGRAVEVRLRAEVTATTADVIDDLGVLGELGFEAIYGLTREVLHIPGWADRNSDVVDVTNQLTIAMRRNRLVAVHTDITTEAQFKKWVRRGAAPFEFLPADVLAGTFPGDGKMVWMRGAHRRRTTKADSKALGGIRIQDAVHPIEDGSYTLAAAKVDFQPDDDTAVLRDLVTVSPGKSRVSWKRPSYFRTFLLAAGEVLDRLEKALVAPDAPDPLFPDFAVPETNLGRVGGAFDIRVLDPDQARGDPDADEDLIERAELMQDALLEVRGQLGSATATVDVGYDGALAGTLAIKPVPVGDEFGLDVRISGPVLREPIVRQIKDAIEGGDLLTVYYQSGHAFDGRHVVRQRLVSRPFPMTFMDFTDFAVAREKPRRKPGQSLHDAIADDGDDSLFAWVVHQFGDGWLLCDDGPGEVADFLHVADDGTLTVIHVKAAASQSPDRGIAVTRYEQVVSQAEKNIVFLDNDTLVDRLSGTRTAGSAAWHADRRVPASDFVDQLRTRVASDKTFVAIVQPHLQSSVHDQARAAAKAGQPNHDSSSLMLLDNILHSTWRTISARCDDLIVIGANT